MIKSTLTNLSCRLQIVLSFVEELGSAVVEEGQEHLLFLEVLFSSRHYSEDLDRNLLVLSLCKAVEGIVFHRPLGHNRLDWNHQNGGSWIASLTK